MLESCKKKNTVEENKIKILKQNYKILYLANALKLNDNDVNKRTEIY